MIAPPMIASSVIISKTSYIHNHWKARLSKLQNKTILSKDILCDTEDILDNIIKINNSIIKSDVKYPITITI